MLTVERLKEVLHYDPETGIWTWLKLTSTRSRIQIGSKAGCLDKDEGYIKIWIDNKGYKAHRLAWFYMTGEWPECEIDHKNTIRHDNRWDNLRKSSHGQNQHNRSRNRNNTSGYKGINFNKAANKWMVRVMLNKKSIYLGIYDTMEEAIKIRQLAIEKYHKEFSRDN